MTTKVKEKASNPDVVRGKINPDAQIKRSNAFADIFSASGIRLNALEYKILMTCASQIKRADTEFQTVYFSVKDLSAELGLGQDSLYTELKKVTASLIGKQFEIKRGNETFQGTLLSSAHYKEGEGIVALRFDDTMGKIFFVDTQYYTSKLKTAYVFNSQYEIPLYEFLKANSWKRDGFYITLDELKDRLNATKKTYQEFKDFNKKIIKPAQEHFKNNTDISFTYELKRQNRKVIGIHFWVKKIVILDVELMELKEQLLYYGISEASFTNMVYELKIENNQIRENLEYTLKKQEEMQIKSSLAGYLYRAIISNYAKKSDIDLEAEKQELEKNRQVKEILERNKKIEKEKKEYEKIIQEQVLEFIEDNDKIALAKEFYSLYKTHFILSKYLKEEMSLDDMLANHLIAPLLRNYIRRNKLDISTSLCDFLKLKKINVTEDYLYKYDLL